MGEFEILRKPTKKLKAMLNLVAYWETLPNAPRTIWDAYKNPSDNKERIYNAWKEWFKEEKDFRIIYSGCMFFGIAVVTDYCIYYINSGHNYMIEMNQAIYDMLEELRVRYK